MILSDTTINKLINNGEITIEPDFDPKDIRPTGIRLHLGEEIMIPESNQTIDLAEKGEIKYKKAVIDPNKGYECRPGDFLLGTILEKFKVPRDIVCQIDGRSTPARLGLSIHCTSQTIDGNYEEAQSVTLEIKNNGPFTIILKPKIAIAMLVFVKLTEPISQNIESKYKGQRGVTPPSL